MNSMGYRTISAKSVIIKHRIVSSSLTAKKNFFRPWLRLRHEQAPNGSLPPKTLVHSAVAWIGFSPLFVFPESRRYLKNRAARNTKIDIQMFHDESWKSHFRHFHASACRWTPGFPGVGFCSLVNAGYLRWPTNVCEFCGRPLTVKHVLVECTN